ncbi:MAG TPA: hypothetical protein VGR13_01095, partial [Actinomycetota bacterium]|nr:hypothetical protein [Actinomycetota bacterium]
MCDESETRILTPAVRLRADGADFSIENVTEATLLFNPENADDERPGTQSELASSGDNSVPPGVKGMRWLIPPGLYRIVCSPQGRPLPSDQIRSEQAVIQVVDPDHIYVPIPSELDCQGGADHNYELSLPLRSGDPGEPIRVVREGLEGLQPGDVVAQVGYPGDRSPWVKIDRAQKVVGLVSMEPTFGKGVLWTCVSSGIRRAEPIMEPKRPRIPSPIPTDTFPPQSRLVEGESYWVLYLAIAEKGSPELEDAIHRAHLYGYEPHVRRLGCDERADERYRLPKDYLAVGVYFDHER